MATKQTNFRQRLRAGKIVESKIARWLINKHGRYILPVYEKELGDNKGPQFFTPHEAIIAPDMLVFSGCNITWVEAKSKSAFTWHRITQRWTTGIDLKHYSNYLRLTEISPYAVWLLFLQQKGRAKDSPDGCPIGLFGGELIYLSQNESHRSLKWGHSGMVYWAHEILTKFAELDEIEKYQHKRSEWLDE